jgi:hypothetical protein
MTDPDLLHVIANRLARHGHITEAADLSAIAVRHARLLRALDEIAEDARLNAEAAENADNVVSFNRRVPFSRTLHETHRRPQ